LLIFAIHEAPDTPHGTIALVLGLLVGGLAIAVEFIRAWHRKELFIQNKAKIASRRARNKKLGKLLTAPGALLGIILLNSEGPIVVFLLAASASYLLP